MTVIDGPGPAPGIDHATVCRSCGGRVEPCRRVDGRVVLVDPWPREGGTLVVNARLRLVIADAADGRPLWDRPRHGAGYVEHRAVCPDAAEPG